MYPDLRLKLKAVQKSADAAPVPAAPSPGPPPPPMAECHLYGDQDTEPYKAIKKSKNRIVRSPAKIFLIALLMIDLPDMEYGTPLGTRGQSEYSQSKIKLYIKM